jgi:hypothetical protein
VLAGLRRNPGAAFATVVAVVVLAIPVGFWLVLRTLRSDPDPPLESAQTAAHRLLRGTESIDTDARAPDRIVFRIVYQRSDGGVASTKVSTNDGVAVCMRGDRAVDAARFSYVEARPACQSGQVELLPR